jgi:hypothetical protein
MKGTQARMTTAFMLRCIHLLVNEIYPQGVIYYFPSRDSVEDFSKTRFTPLIANNPCISRYLKSTDSIFVKQVNDAFLSLKGATATTNIQGRKKDSPAVRSMPADEIIRDERDLFDDDIVDMMPDRLLNSEFKREVDLGSPTIHDYGIAKAYENSDKKQMMHECDCGSFTCLAEEWPKCVKYERATSHTEFKPYFACIKCGNPINNLSGVFKATRQSDVSGYHVPHLITPRCELELVMKRWEEAQEDDTKFGLFQNSILGLPHTSTEERLTENDVFACCGNDVMRSGAGIAQTALGADIGKHYHTIVIAEKVDEKRAKIIHMARIKGFEAIHDLAKKFNVKSAVIDRRPYEEEFEKFQQAEPYRVFGAEYKDRQKAFCKTDEKTGTYSLLRTQVFDKTHYWFKNKQVEIPRRSAEVKEFARQVCNCAKIYHEDDQGNKLYRYIKMGDDHYRSAVNYLYIALQDLTAWQGMSTPGYGIEEDSGDWNPLD